MNRATMIAALLDADPLRRELLAAVRALDLPDCWIAAGFVRDAVWDHLHDRPPRPPHGDVDVIWFQESDAGQDRDRALERALAESMPGIPWSVKNQARMHLRNGDSPYLGSVDAMRFWPETATAVAARLDEAGAFEIAAPLGLDDLFALRLVPTKGFLLRKRDQFDGRIAAKDWLARYPKLGMGAAHDSP